METDGMAELRPDGMGINHCFLFDSTYVVLSKDEMYIAIGISIGE